MIKEKFMLYQEAVAENGVLYTLKLDVPYSADNTKESAQTRLNALAPEDIALGSIAKFHSEDENGSEFIWEFEWEQNEEEEKLFMLTHETYINRVPNGEVVPTGTIEITENGEGIDVSEYAYADVNVSGGGLDDIPTFVADEDNVTATCNKTFAECKALCEGGGSDNYSYPCRVDDVYAQETSKEYSYMVYDLGKIFVTVNPDFHITYEADGTLTLNRNN